MHPSIHCASARRRVAATGYVRPAQVARTGVCAASGPRRRGRGGARRWLASVWAAEGGGMTYQVTVKDVQPRPTAVVPATTTWEAFPTLWRQLLDEVWACLRASGIDRGCRNVMLYRDDVPNVEVGVELGQPCPLTGRVVASSVPAGRVAMTVH